MDKSNQDLQREVGMAGSGRAPPQHADYRIPEYQRGGAPANGAGSFTYSLSEHKLGGGDPYGAHGSNSAAKYAQNFIPGTGQAVEQTLGGQLDDGTQTHDEMAVRPSEPHFEEQTASRYGQVEMQSERSNVPALSATAEYGNVREGRNNQVFQQSLNTHADSQQRAETGNFNYQQTSTDVRGELAGAAETAQKIDSQQYRVRQGRGQNLYAPPNQDMHLDGYGGAALPQYPSTNGPRQRALSGGPTVRTYSNSRNHSISAGGSNRSGSVGVGSPASKKSGVSRRSGMTRNPLHFEDKQLQHAGPGIDDRVSHLYREYDNSKRVDQSFYQRAALAGIKNLETISYRKDSTVQQTQGRFPEKYVNTIRKSDTNYSSRKNSLVNRTDATMRSAAVESFNLASQMLRNIEDTQPLRTKQSPARELSNHDDIYKEMSMSEQQLILEAAFTAVCDNIMSSQMHGNTDSWLSLSIDDKLLQFASFLSHMRKDYRLGAIVGVYILFKNNVVGGITSASIDDSLRRDEHEGPYGGVLGNYDPQKPEVAVFMEKDGHFGQIGQEITKVIIEEVFASLTEFKNQDPLLIKCELEVIGLFGVHHDIRSSGRLQILRNLLQDQNAIVKQKLIPNVMATMIQIGYEGLRELLDIAERDVNGLQDQIVSLLIQMRIMQRLVIVPSILAQINQSYDPLVKQESLAMLNRLGTLVWESGGLPLIIELLDQGIVDRQLLASVLRTSGGEGEQLLLKLLKFHQNEKVRASAAAVLAYRLPTDQLKMQVTIQLSNDQFEIFDHTKTLRPGQMCTYRNGKISSLVFEELKTPNILEEEETPLSNADVQNFRGSELGKQGGLARFQKQRQPRIEVHARDFLASLSRVMQMNESYFQRMFENDDYSKRSMLKILNINVLNGFNSMNVQCILPRIDQNLTHTPHIDFMDLDQMNISQDSMSFQQRQQEQQNNKRVAISQEIVKALCQQLLKEEKTKVREVIAGTIGQIGKPEAHVNICVDALIKAAATLKKSEESILKSMIIWSLGRLASYETGMKAKKILMEALQSPHWRVRAAACTSIANFGPILADCCLPILMKLLRDGSQNKQIVAETIISLGPRGETEMISLLRTNESKNRILNNNKSKECIVKSLALANIEHPNIDFIIETLFYTYSHDSNASIRKASLIALDILHKKSEKLQHEQTVQQTQFMMASYRRQDEGNQSMTSQRNNSFTYGPNETNRSMSSGGSNRRGGSYVMGKRPHFNTYLQPKNLLPFFYKCLADKSPQVRECALLCIKNFGAHGELLFIEGVSKESNPVLRAECALGLGSIGPQTFRSLLLALHDEHQIVKDQASQAILNNMTVYQIREQFQDSEHQRQTICCTIRELMVGNNPNGRSFLRQDIIHFLDNVLEVFEQMMNESQVMSLRAVNEQLNFHEGVGIRSRSKDRIGSPASERARSPHRGEKGPLEMFQAAHQDINPLPPKKRPQSSSTYGKNAKVNPQQSRRMSKIDQAAQIQNSRYESSGKMAPKRIEQNNLFMDATKFLHHLKEEAVQDQRHAPIRIQNQGYTVASSRRGNPGRLPPSSRGMAGPGAAGYPPSYQYSISSNYSHIDNPISKLNNLRSQEALLQYRLQEASKESRASPAVAQDGQTPSQVNPAAPYGQ